MKRKKPVRPVHYAKDANGKYIRIPIREIRPGYYLVDYRREGKVDNKCFSDLAQAETHARGLAVDRRNLGLAAFDLSSEQRQDALRAMALLAGSATLEQACREYVKRHPVKGGETITTTAAGYIRLMRREGARRISIKDKLWKFRVIVKGLGASTLTAGIDLADLNRLLDARGITSKRTRGNYRGALASMLNFYRGQRRDRQRHDEVLPVVWKPAQVAHLLATATKDAPDIVPALACLFFAGLRPHEMFRLDWKNIRLADGYIQIDPETSKVRSARTVDISPNLTKWLAPYQKKSGLVSGGQFVFRRLRELVMVEAGVTTWPVDVARHTFATAFYVQHGDAAKVMQQLGHFGSLATFTRHYKSLMSTKEAQAFWKIEPPQGKVIQLRRSA